ncbi:DUF3471 domain-containing protein [Aestuariivivens insulae]|uniref:DUF3471 domain-containing protein n=1 Tax=Aestuariivivens insulae TaxID=1621988 RepID=UPI001F58ACB7|nr:PHB depolymerase family esterase [Aestuariivivens insulae]
MKFKAYLVLWILGMQLTMAQQSSEKFIIEQQYLKYLPEDYDTNTEKKWPLMIFLHGSGERGEDLEKVKVHGPTMLVEQGKTFPFIIISPQAKRGWDEDILYQMINDVISKHRVDTDRVYLTGLSMGGYGTWKLAQKYPEMFAAIVPICGGGNPKEVWKLRHMPVWCFHGKLDGIVPISASEAMINALKPINDEVKFTVYPETYHNSWVQAYNDPELYEWLLNQTKHKHKAIELSLATLEQYVGKYNLEMGTRKDTCTVAIEDKKLTVTVNQGTTVLKPSSEDTFFIDENQPVEFQFRKNKDGIVDEIILYTNERLIIPKIKD